jgi:hypothetical protein
VPAWVGLQPHRPWRRPLRRLLQRDTDSRAYWLDLEDTVPTWGLIAIAVVIVVIIGLSVFKRPSDKTTLRIDQR